MNPSPPAHNPPPAGVIRLAILVTALMTILSLTGLLFPMGIYASEELRLSFLANDVVNLVIGLPVLLGTLLLARQGKLAGLLGLPGALLYVTYNSIAYAAAMPFTPVFFLHLLLACMSAWAIYQAVSSADGESIEARLQNRVPERFGAGVLMGFGALFFVRAVAEIFDGAAGMAEFGVLIADGLTTPLWIIGSLYLWRKKPAGYVCGAGLLLQASMLFVGLLAFFILQPFTTGVPFPLEDFVVILGMGLVVFVPFGLFVKGVLKTQQA